MMESAREWIRHNCRFAIGLGMESIDQATQEGQNLVDPADKSKEQATTGNYPEFSKKTVDDAKKGKESLDKVQPALQPDEQAILTEMLRDFGIAVDTMDTSQKEMATKYRTTQEQRLKQQTESEETI